jgi:ParB-like chromosome segregation protein Spo0J
MLRDLSAYSTLAIVWLGVFLTKPTAQSVQVVEAWLAILLLLRPVIVVEGYVAVDTHHRWTAAAYDRLGNFVLNI